MAEISIVKPRSLPALAAYHRMLQAVAAVTKSKSQLRVKDFGILGSILTVQERPDPCWQVVPSAEAVWAWLPEHWPQVRWAAVKAAWQHLQLEPVLGLQWACAPATG